ncbi:MAG: DNA repair protein RecO [Chloroflexaceae bacterium]|nr:DNA repair protein RecO [Chloroflexaceae bacterium]
MSERVYRTEALILRRGDLGEADRWLMLATPTGKRRVKARGVRKTTSRLAGHIELFTHVDMLLARGRSFDIVTQSQVISPFTRIHADLARLGGAYYVAELYDAFTCDGEEQQTLFTLLQKTFHALERIDHGDLVLRTYELQLLHAAGYQPSLHTCPVCQTPLDETAHQLSATLGGVLCMDHAHTDSAAQPISLRAFKVLRYLQRESWTNIERLHLSDDVREEIERLLRWYLRHMLEHDLKTVAFLETIDHPQIRPTIRI